MSLQQVADTVGASKAHVWELETGRSANPSLDLLGRLAGLFEVSIAYLVGEKEEADQMRVRVFGREFEDLSEGDWDMLRNLAKRMKTPSAEEPPDER